MLKKIAEKTLQIEPLLIEIRRHLHKNPELSCEEFQTADYIYTKLKEYGIEAEKIKTNSGPAVIAHLHNDKNTETIAFRADMDALPVIDKKMVSYKSQNLGVTHACGHDFNTTVVLGTAIILAGLKEQLDVNIKFIFQPSEEKAEGGSLALIKQNVMDNVNAIWTIHAAPHIPAGQIGIGKGAISSATDSFYIQVKGKGGHSARPHEAIDAIFIANTILSEIYAGIPRNFDPISPIVLSIGKINGGTAPNIISETCEIEGTSRTFDLNIRDQIQTLIKNKAYIIAKSYNADINIKWQFGPPPIINDKILAQLVKETALNLLGKENVHKIKKPSMGAEDFSRYLSYAPGVLIRVGTGGTQASYPLHSPYFDIDEKAIGIAVNLLCGTCINFQENKCSSRDYIENFVV